MNELAHSAKDLKVQITASALHERIDGSAAMLLAGVLNLALRDLRKACPLGLKKLDSFRAIYVTDSRQIALPAALAEIFKGNQGNAMLKLQVTWDYLNGNLVALELEDGKSADQKSRLPLQVAQKESLELFDLGYFKQEHLREIAAKGAYFVSRYKSKTGLYHGDDAWPFDLVTVLKSLLDKEAEYALLVGGRVHLPLPF